MTTLHSIGKALSKKAKNDSQGQMPDGHAEGTWPPTPSNLVDNSNSVPKEKVNGTLILLVGILGLFVGICGPIAWLMGNNALRKIDSGVGDPSERSSASAGRLLGMIMSIIIVLMFVGIMIAAVMGNDSMRAAHTAPPTYR